MTSTKNERNELSGKFNVKILKLFYIITGSVSFYRYLSSNSTIILLIMFSVHHFIYKTSENNKKCKTKSSNMKFYLTDSPKYLVYGDVRQEKSANNHIKTD